MQDKLLLIHQQYTPEDQVIWRAALKAGWKTYRISKERQYDENAPTADIIRYYGNMLDEPKMLSYGIKQKRIPEGYLARIPPEITKRNIWTQKFNEVESPSHDYFVKCQGIKWFPAQVYKKGETIIGCTNPNDIVYVQEPVRFVEEYRCFVLDGKIRTTSRYKGNGIENGNVDDDFWLIANFQLIVDKIYKLNILPNAVVMDFGRIYGRGWCFIEANEALFSGIYDCNPDEAFKVIIESQTNE